MYTSFSVHRIQHCISFRMIDSSTCCFFHLRYLTFPPLWLARVHPCRSLPGIGMCFSCSNYSCCTSGVRSQYLEPRFKRSYYALLKLLFRSKSTATVEILTQVSPMTCLILQSLWVLVPRAVWNRPRMPLRLNVLHQVDNQNGGCGFGVD